MDYEDLKMKHSAFRKRSTGQHHERKWIKWPGIKCSTGPVCGLWVRRISRQIWSWSGSHPGQMREALMTWSSRVASHHKYCIKLYIVVFCILGLGGNTSKQLLGESTQSWILHSRSLNRANFLLSCKHLKFRRIKGNDCIRKILNEFPFPYLFLVSISI